MEELERNVENQSEQNENAVESKVEQQNTNIPRQLTCPRCGKQFDPKEKKCPHCGLKNNLKLCKTCGATIAKNAKRCPKCGAKNKKPFYRRVAFWAIIVLLLLIVSCTASNDNTNGTTNTSNSAAPAEKTTEPLSSEENLVVGQWNLIGVYIIDQEKLNDMDAEELKIEFNADRTGEMTTSDNTTTPFEWSYAGTTSNGDKVYQASGIMASIVGNGGNLIQYAGDLIITSDKNTLFILERNDSGSSTKTTTFPSSTSTTETPSKSKVVSSKVSIGKQDALKKADEYLNVMAFSYSGLIEQLEYEGFSTEDATYAADHCGADWMEQAAKKAAEYLNTMAFSRSSLIDQLEYEGFTAEQAKYGAEQNGY